MSFERLSVVFLLIVCTWCFMTSVIDARRWPSPAEDRKLRSIVGSAMELRNTFKRLGKEMRQKEFELQKLKKELKIHEQKSYGFIAAFVAYAHKTRAYGPNEVVQFKQTGIHIATNYNKWTSKFSCRDTGLYVFTVTIAGGQDPSFFDLVVNGKTLAQGITGGSHKASGTVMGIMRCRRHRQVWVRAHNFQDDKQYPYQVMRNSQFIGFKLGNI